MAWIVAVYQGKTVGDARLVTVSTDQQLVGLVLARMREALAEEEASFQDKTRPFAANVLRRLDRMDADAPER